MFNIRLGFPSKLICFVSVFFCIHCLYEKEADNKTWLCFANYDLRFLGFLYFALKNAQVQYLCQHGITDKLLGKIGTNQSSLRFPFSSHVLWRQPVRTFLLMS